MPVFCPAGHDCSIHYVDTGPASEVLGAVVLLLGTGSSANSYPAEIGFIQSLGYRVVAIDFRDGGHSVVDHALTQPSRFDALDESPRSNNNGGLSWFRRLVVNGLIAPMTLGLKPKYNMHNVMEDASLLVDRVLGRTTTFHLVGYSLGGLAAQEYAIHFPGRVKSLTLAASPHILRSKDHMVSQMPSPFWLFTSLVKTKTNKEGLRNLARLTTTVHDEEEFEEFLASVQRSKDCGPEHLDGATCRQLHAALDGTCDPRRIRVPTLVAVGADDPLVGGFNGEALQHDIRGSKMVRLENVRHVIVGRAFRGFIMDHWLAFVQRAEENPK